MIFKSMYYAHVKPITVADTNLPSYFAKTVMFWASEEVPVKEWKKENMENNLKMLFQMLASSLDLNERKLSHYFIPQINLLDPYTNDELLTKALKTTLQICSNPMSFIPSNEIVIQACGQTKELLKILEKFIEFVDMVNSDNSIVNIVENLRSSGLSRIVQGDDTQGAGIALFRNLSQVVRMFDQSNSTQNTMDLIDSVLNVLSGAENPCNRSDSKDYEEESLD